MVDFFKTIFWEWLMCLIRYHQHAKNESFPQNCWSYLFFIGLFLLLTPTAENDLTSNLVVSLFNFCFFIEGHDDDNILFDIYIILFLHLLIHLFTHSWTSCNVMCVYWLTIIYLFVLSFVCPFVHSFIPLPNFEFHGPLFQSKANYLLFTNSSTFCQRWHFLVFEKKCIRCFCFLYLHLLNK